MRFHLDMATCQTHHGIWLQKLIAAQACGKHGSLAVCESEREGDRAKTEGNKEIVHFAKTKETKRDRFDQLKTPDPQIISFARCAPEIYRAGQNAKQASMCLGIK